MTPARLSILLAALLALASLMWLSAALRLLPASDWPALPLNPQRMSLGQILLGFGLMPRGVIALLAGAALGLSGALLQAVLRNPVADPTTLGISSGAQLALVIATILTPSLLDTLGRWPVAMGGAVLAAALVMAIGAARAFAPVTMVIAGMLIAMTASAIATAITLAQGEYLLSLVIWNGGSLVQQDWSGVRGLTAILLAGAGAAALLARPLRVLSLGVEGARGLGLNVTAIRLAAMALAVALAGSVSAELGLIGFVGLAAPALARTLGARNMVQVLWLAPPIGALILSLCDGLVLAIAGRLHEMFPTGALTGLIGGPLLIWLLPRLRGSTPPEPRPPKAAPAAAPPGKAAGGIGAVADGGGADAGLDRAGARRLDRAGPRKRRRLPAAAAAASGRRSGRGRGAGAGRGAVATADRQPAGLARGAGRVGRRHAWLCAGAVHDPRPIGASADRRQHGGRRAGAGAAGDLCQPPRHACRTCAAGRNRGFRPVHGGSVGDDGGGRCARLCGAVMAQRFVLGHRGREAVAMALLAVLLLVAALLMRRWLAVLPLGTGVSTGLGLPLRRARLAIVGLAGLATGAATMLVGPLSFVGLMAPHLARRAGFARPQDQIAAAALIGAALMMTADFGARMAGFPYELPLGLFASLIGAPWLLWLMMRKTR